MFEIKNKRKKFHFFKKTFLSAKISIDFDLKILFLILSNVKMNFIKLKIFGKLTPL